MSVWAISEEFISLSVYVLQWASHNKTYFESHAMVKEPKRIINATGYNTVVKAVDLHLANIVHRN